MTMTTTTATADSEEDKPQRERGTLKDTLPRRPILIVALVCVASAILATALFVYSSLKTVDDNDLAKLGFGACLGAVSTSVGILFGDSLSHMFAFGLALLFIDYSNIKSSVLAASPPLILAAFASTKGPRSIISSLDSSFLLKPIILQSCCLLPFLTLIHQSILNAAYLKISTIPSCFVAFITLLLMHLYGKHRAHKNGSLLTSEMKSQAIFAGVSTLLSCSIVMEIKPEASKALVVFLLGSLFLLLMSCGFASVADAWYAVGSGQFQMVSLDTAGIMVFFIYPAVVLHFRFLDKYGVFVSSKLATLKEYLQSTGVLSDGEAYGGDIISFSLVMTLAMITSVGVPLLNALCPMGGYLFSRAYTHGQPNTKKVALCVNFSDLPKDNEKRDHILNHLVEKKSDSQKTTAILNIFVTLEDLTLCSTELKSIAEKGHAIALAPSEFPQTFCGLSLFQGNKSSCNIEIAHHEYSVTFAKEPSWLLAKSADSIGRNPVLLREASDLGMKIAYWSTMVELAGDCLTSEQKSAISGDCSDKNGGSIIYVALEQAVSPSSHSDLICEVVDVLDGFSLESLSDVAKDAASMILK